MLELCDDNTFGDCAERRLVARIVIVVAAADWRRLLNVKRDRKVARRLDCLCELVALRIRRAYANVSVV